MRKNFSPQKVERKPGWPLTGNMSQLTEALSRLVKTSTSPLLLVSFLPPHHPWEIALANSLQEIEKLSATPFPKESPHHLLALVPTIEKTGQLALATDQLSLAGAILCPKEDGFFLTTFGKHHFQTDRMDFQDLALSASPSLREMEILVLGLVLYSGGLVFSLLEAVDLARGW